MQNLTLHRIFFLSFGASRMTMQVESLGQKQTFKIFREDKESDKQYLNLKKIMCLIIDKCLM